MSSNKNVDAAASLEALSPIILKQYAIYVPAFDPYGTPHYAQPYRRYATAADMKTAANAVPKSGGAVKFYQFNFETDSWEEYDD